MGGQRSECPGQPTRRAPFHRKRASRCPVGRSRLQTGGSISRRRRCHHRVSLADLGAHASPADPPRMLAQHRVPGRFRRPIVNEPLVAGARPIGALDRHCHTAARVVRVHADVLAVGRQPPGGELAAVPVAGTERIFRHCRGRQRAENDSARANAIDDGRPRTPIFSTAPRRSRVHSRRDHRLVSA